MDSVQETLIAIASASQRVIDSLVVRACSGNDVSRRQLAGDLHRIVAASQTLLAEALKYSPSAESAVDDRLETWLSSREPKTCLDVLHEMEVLVKSSPSGVASTLRNIFLSAPIEDKSNQAIQFFEKHRVYFYFLFNTNVWNHGAIIMGQPKGRSINTQSIRRGLVDRNTNFVERSWKKKTWSKIDRTRLNEILEWLDAWDCTEKHEDTLELRQRNTCAWLPDTDEYQTWRHASDVFLWLHGKPGSGKSVLAASVINKIQNTMDKGELLAFFYCDFRNERSTIAAEVMRSLLSQLLQGLRDIGVDPGDILDVLGKEKIQKHTILGKSKRLASLTLRVAKQYPRPPLVVVDALDECKDIENLLCSLMDLNEGGVRLFAISRPLQVIKDRFSGVLSLSLEQMSTEVDMDIRLHVRREVDSHRRLRDAGIMLKEDVIERLCHEADGMFRWIECQLKTLKGCFTTSEIREALYSLPIGLDATYQRILLAISKEERGDIIAKRALMWIVSALQPLSLCQIVEALSIDLDLRMLNPDSAPIHGHALLDSLSSLVTHTEETDIVQLSHFSVKEYLVGNFVQENHLYHINWQDAHAQVAQQCMGYITACLTSGLQDSDDHPLLDYVLDYGFHHLSYVEPTDRILDSIRALHRDIQQHPLEWEQFQRLERVRAAELPSLQHDFVLYSLIRYAPDPLLDLFLCYSPVTEKEGINPLIYVVPGRIEHARTLLWHGAKLGLSGQFIETHDFPSGLPIEAAVGAGDSGLVDLFLEEGSPVPHRLFSNPLFGRRKYSHNSDAHILTRLLQTDEFTEWAIDVLNEKLLIPALHGLANWLDWKNSAEGDVVVMARRLQQIGCDLASAGHTSFVEALLRNAAHTGDISSIQRLLSDLKMELPPDILLDLRRSFLWNQRSDVETIRFLIQNGANIHAASADESTVLHHGVRSTSDMKSCLEKTKLLCKAGCSPSVYNLLGTTPIHIAVNLSDLSVARHLLSVGAFLPPDILFGGDICHRGLSSSMIRFLLEEGANARAVAANGDSALHAVLRHRSTDTSVARLESVKMLVAAGCGLRITNWLGKTCLDIAVVIGHISVIKYFISLNIPFSPDILLSVCRRLYDDPANFTVMVRLLLKSGADPNASTLNGDTALHLAMTCAGWEDEQFRFQIVKTLVGAGCDPSACNIDGRTVLHVAGTRGYMKIMEYLLSLPGALVPPDIFLSLSYSHATPQVLQLLINKGADVHAITADGDTPLHYAIFHGSESSALKCAEFFVAARNDPHGFSVTSWTPMHAAAERGYISVIKYLLSLSVPLPPDVLLAATSAQCTTIVHVVRFLIDKGADITSITTEGNTALHLAIGVSFRSDLLETAKILIGAGCDVNACNSDGHTPLYTAALCGQLDVAKYLLSQGASISPGILLAAIFSGDLDVMEYLLSQSTSVPPSAFLAAASCERSLNKVQAVRFLSTLSGVDVHVLAPNGDTALHRAVEFGDENDCLETAKLLVYLGCDASLCNSAGKSPLHIAAKRYHLSVLKYLLSQGVLLPSDVLLSAVSALLDKPGVPCQSGAAMTRFLIREGADPCVVNDEGDTALHIFLRHVFCDNAIGEWWTIQILLDAGADPYARNLDGQTPVDLAERRGPFFAKNFMRLVKQAKAPIAP